MARSRKSLVESWSRSQSDCEHGVLIFGHLSSTSPATWRVIPIMSNTADVRKWLSYLLVDSGSGGQVSQSTSCPAAAKGYETPREDTRRRCRGNQLVRGHGGWCGSHLLRPFAAFDGSGLVGQEHKDVHPAPWSRLLLQTRIVSIIPLSRSLFLTRPETPWSQRDSTCQRH